MNMVVIAREQFLQLRQALPAATKVGLQETFGVSETTWVRLRDGRPIRRSTYERLMRRLDQIASRSRVG